MFDLAFCLSPQKGQTGAPPVSFLQIRHGTTAGALAFLLLPAPLHAPPPSLAALLCRDGPRAVGAELCELYGADLQRLCMSPRAMRSARAQVSTGLGSAHVPISARRPASVVGSPRGLAFKAL